PYELVPQPSRLSSRCCAVEDDPRTTGLTSAAPTGACGAGGSMAAHQTHSYPVIQTIVILGKPSSQSNRRPARPRSLKPQTGKRWGIGPMPYNLDLLPH